MKLIQYKDKGKILVSKEEHKCKICEKVLKPVFYMGVEDKGFVCSKHMKPNVEYYKIIGVDTNDGSQSRNRNIA